MRLYDTLTRQLQELRPAPGPIGMYFCGPTVYQRIHIGNARPFVVSMWLRSWLRQQGFDVTLVINVTDINDKIYDAAREQGIPSAELAARATRWYFDDTGRLGLGRPDAEPLATETVPEIVSLIESLVAEGLAYEADGDVYFRVARFGEYGCLSGQRPDQVEEQEPNARKEDARDFALWKGWKETEDTFWESPWGRGRPGWHIECSAMAEKLLGREFDVHGGGLDLIFPHHENEIAQSCGAGRAFARVWAHNGMLRMTGEKMSKSLGNIQMLADVLDEWGRETVLLYFLTGLWRNPIDFSDEALTAARSQLATFREALRGGGGNERDPAQWAEFSAALDDDFNTPRALAVMHAWRATGQDLLLADALELFGLGALAGADEAPSDVVELAEQRQRARVGKQFAEADRLRDAIADAGWDVRDVAGGFQLVRRS